MAVVLKEYTSNSTNGTASSIILTQPATAVTGDLAILLVGNENSANGEGFDTIPGWTKWQIGSGAQDCYGGYYWKILDGSEGASIVVPFLGNDDGHGWYLVLNGHDPIAPLDLQGSGATVGTTLVHGLSSSAITSGSMYISMVAFDGTDGDPWTINSTWTRRSYLESPNGSDSGNGSSGAFADAPNRAAQTRPYDPRWTNNGTSDGMVAFAIRITAKAELLGSAAITSASNLTAEGTYRAPDLGSASLTSSASFTAAGEYTPPIYGSASLASTSSVTAQGGVKYTSEVTVVSEAKASFYQSILYTLVVDVNGKFNIVNESAVTANSRLELFGSASIVSTGELIVQATGTQTGKATIIGTSTVAVDGIVQIEYKGSASLSNTTDFTCSGLLNYLGRSTIVNDSLVIFDGEIGTIPVSAIADRLEERIEALEALVGTIPTGDFLKAEDLEAFYRRDEGSIHGL